MFTLKQKICVPGSADAANEDIACSGKNYCFVIDGASCLSGVNVMDCGSDAAWMVQEIAERLGDLLEKDTQTPTQALLGELVADLREQYLQALAKQGITQPADSPSAGIALFRVRQGRLEFFGLGDCVGVAQLPDGESFVSFDEQLVKLDNGVLEKMQQMHKQTGVGVLQARHLCNEQLIENRAKRNRPGGYWILDLLTDVGLKNARQYSWPLTQPIRVGAYSDGFAELSEHFGIYRDAKALFDAMQETDLNQMYTQLKQAQDSDPDCNAYPRFKLRDDTSALWGVFE